MRTISSLAIVFFSILTAVTLRRQARNIRNNPAARGRSVSVSFFLYFAALMPIQMAYGWEEKEWPMIANAAIRFVFFCPVLLALWKHKGYSRPEKLVFWLLTGTSVVGCVHPSRGVLFFWLCVGGALLSATAAWEMWKQKSAGVVAVKYHWIGLVNVTFWFIYGLLAGKWEIWGPVLAYWPVILLTLRLYYVYRRHERLAMESTGVLCPEGIHHSK